MRMLLYKETSNRETRATSSSQPAARMKKQEKFLPKVSLSQQPYFLSHFHPISLFFPARKGLGWLDIWSIKKMLAVFRRWCETEKDKCVQRWLVGNADSENKQNVNLKYSFWVHREIIECINYWENQKAVTIELGFDRLFFTHVNLILLGRV